MEEKKLSVDHYNLGKRDMQTSQIKHDEADPRLPFPVRDNSRFYSDNDNWFELRFSSLGPDRRGYHSSFQHNKKLFIYGGHDIREGSKDSLWVLDLRKLKDLDLDPSLQSKDCQWKQVTTKGDDKPGCLAHHTSVVFGDKMFLFGGSNLEFENRKFFSLDLNHFRWDVVKSRGDLPITRDEHTCVVYDHESSMIIFGGFCNGERTNEIIKYLFQENRWVKLNLPLGSLQPSPRSGHSACIFENAMYVFGGKDDDNNKLNDLWRLDLNTYQWNQVKLTDDIIPLERAGHSCDIFDSYMVIFGGIYEITKELNDLYMFDFKRSRWITIFEESHSPKRDQSPYANEEVSPIGGFSPKKTLNGSPNVRKTGSPPKNSSKILKPSTSSKIKKNLNLSTHHTQPMSRNSKGNGQMMSAIQLTTPTSISMMNSFIIKNADTSFDQYYSSMKKRKQMQNLSSTFNNNQQNNQHNTSQMMTGHDTSYGKNKGKRPAARDGHSGIIFGKYFIVFGGDRHHMPFNDTFALDLKGEITSKSFLFA